MAYPILIALLFGVLEGITEWLPVSSTGHIILLAHFLPSFLDKTFFSLFEVVIQLGAILAVLVRFFHTVFPFFRGNTRETRKNALLLWGKLLLSALPSAVVGLLLDDLLDTYLFNPVTVAVTLMIYGVAFLVVEKRRQQPRITHASALSYTDALLVGCFQVLALIPGTSRSGATILGGLLCGISRPVVAEFSFLLAIPTMVGAALLKTVKLLAGGYTPSGTEVLLLSVGTLAAFLVSLAVIGFLMEFVRRHSFAPFGIYRILLGLAVLLLLLL